MTLLRKGLAALALGLTLLGGAAFAQTIPDTAATASGAYRQTVPVVTVGGAQVTVTETTVAMTGLWVRVWTGGTAAKRLIIGLPSTSSASGDYSFNASLSGLSTSGGIPFAGGAGGSFDFAGGAIPNSDLYVKATNGSSVTVQVFN